MVICLFSSKVGMYCGAVFDMIQPLLPTGRNTPSSSAMIALPSSSPAPGASPSLARSHRRAGLPQVAQIDVFARQRWRLRNLAPTRQELGRRLHRLVGDLALLRVGAALHHQDL